MSVFKCYYELKIFNIFHMIQSFAVLSFLFSHSFIIFFPSFLLVFSQNILILASGSNFKVCYCDTTLATCHSFLSFWCYVSGSIYVFSAPDVASVISPRSHKSLDELNSVIPVIYTSYLIITKQSSGLRWTWISTIQHQSISLYIFGCKHQV